MYFDKLTHLSHHPEINTSALKKYDEWLAGIPQMYTDFLNPLDFAFNCLVAEKIALKIFSLSSNLDYFERFNTTPLLKIKYIVSCPGCDSHFKTFYNRADIPNVLSICNDDCMGFNPSMHPENIEITFELLERPVINDELLDVYTKRPDIPSLTADNKDLIGIGLWGDLLRIEEEKFGNE